MSEFLQERMKKAKSDEGFTLIELLIVIIILGVLAAVVIFSIQGLDDKGQHAACRTDKRIMATAEEAFYADSATGVYGTEAQLAAAPDKFIDSASELHNITLGAGNKSYEVIAAPASPCLTTTTIAP